MPILVAMAFKLMREEVDGFLEALSDENLASFLISESPTYTVFTTADLTTAIFGLCKGNMFFETNSPYFAKDFLI